MCGASPEWLTERVSPAVSRRRVSAGASGARVSPSATGAAEVDAELREYLREWRRATAKEQSVPAYVVLHDTSLDEICRVRPGSIAQLMTITGIGERKADLYGHEILSVLRRYQEGARAAALPEKKTAPARETLQLLAEGKSFEEIAQIRGRQMGTVVNAVAGLVEKGEIEFDPAWIDRNKLAVIEAACTNLGLQRLERLKTLKDVLPPEITYDEIRLVVARFRREGSKKSAGISV
jgi:ATP-dependent DNA helicase RecQ